MSSTDVEALYRDHRHAILGYLVRRAPSPEDAAELLAEVFVVALRRVDSIPPGDEAKLWLFGVARLTLANYQRSVRRRDAAVERLASQLRTSAAVDTTPEVLDVRRALAVMNPEDRELLTLVAWEGLTPTEAARVLGMPPSTARTRLTRARRRLKALVAHTDENSAYSAVAPA